MKNIFIIWKISLQWTRKYFNTNYWFNERWIDNATEVEQTFSSRFDAQNEIENMINNEQWLFFIEEFFTR